MSMKEWKSLVKNKALIAIIGLKDGIQTKTR